MLKTENRVTGRSGSSRRYFRVLLWAALVLTSFIGAAGAAEKGASPLSGEWKKALGPLYAMPVQDFGYVRSAFTFGENHLMAVADAHSWQGMDALEAVLYLMANPDVARTAPLIKVVRPELAKLYGAKRDQPPSVSRSGHAGKARRTDSSKPTTDGCRQ